MKFAHTIFFTSSERKFFPSQFSNVGRGFDFNLPGRVQRTPSGWTQFDFLYALATVPLKMARWKSKFLSSFSAYQSNLIWRKSVHSATNNHSGWLADSPTLLILTLRRFTHVTLWQGEAVGRLSNVHMHAHMLAYVHWCWLLLFSKSLAVPFLLFLWSIILALNGALFIHLLV